MLWCKKVETVKYSWKDIVSLTKNSPLPVALKHFVQDTYKCTICHSVPIRPPVIATKCCKTIFGCEVCVNEWYNEPNALTKFCLSCRANLGIQWYHADPRSGWVPRWSQSHLGRGVIIIKANLILDHFSIISRSVIQHNVLTVIIKIEVLFHWTHCTIP